MISIHTFELAKEVDSKCFNNLLPSAYKKAKKNKNRVGYSTKHTTGDVRIDDRFSSDGITIEYHTCGLHVHVNRTAFGCDKSEQDAVISRILFFIERFWQEMLRFSRRTESQINRWAARYGIKDNPKQVMDNAKTTGKGRYACINLCNYYTIEFRIFRGTLKYNTLIATLQMVDRICKAAISMTDEEITSLSWPEFVSVITEPELIQYLKERRLYVNEPVTETEEY